MLVDSHCHLDFAKEEERAGIIARARGAGVRTLLTICTKLDEFPAVRAIAETDPDIWCTIGVHPHEAAVEPAATLEGLVAATKHEKVIGIGETGLDFYYEHSPRERQAEVFRVHIAAAREAQVPRSSFTPVAPTPRRLPSSRRSVRRPASSIASAPAAPWPSAPWRWVFTYLYCRDRHPQDRARAARYRARPAARLAPRRNRCALSRAGAVARQVATSRPSSPIRRRWWRSSKASHQMSWRAPTTANFFMPVRRRAAAPGGGKTIL